MYIQSCSRCKQKTSGNFCEHCGFALSQPDSQEISTPETNAVTWRKQEDEIARRLSWQQYELFIPYGSKALLFENEKLTRTLEQGRYSPRQFSRKLLTFNKTNHYIVFVDTTDLRQNYIIKNIRTIENIPIEICCSFTLAMVNASLFCLNIMKDKTIFRLSHLKTIFFDEIKNALSDYFAKTTIKGMTQSRSIKNIIEQHLIEHLSYTLAKSGFKITHFHSIDYKSNELANIQNTQAKIFLENEFLVQKQQQQEMQRIWHQQTQHQNLEHRHSLSHLQLQHEQQMQQKKQQLNQQKLQANIHNKHSLIIANESIKTEQLKAELERKQFQAQVESRVAEITIEAQKKRAQIALEIQKQNMLQRLEIEAKKKSILKEK